MVLAYIG
jgi:hypothetical protein